MATFVEKIERSNDNPGDPRNQEVVHAAGDPQYGDLATPINSSKLSRAYLNSLSVYRRGASPIRRGLEVGVALGYIFVGPFTKFNPLRYTEVGSLVGLLSAIGLIVIFSISMWLYAASNPPKPLTNIATPNVPDAFQSEEGWNSYSNGFLIGGAIGAVVAYAILANFDVFDNFLHLVGYR